MPGLGTSGKSGRCFRTRLSSNSQSNRRLAFRRGLKNTRQSSSLNCPTRLRRFLLSGSFDHDRSVFASVGFVLSFSRDGTSRSCPARPVDSSRAGSASRTGALAC
jgi:hypothetical protein